MRFLVRALWKCLPKQERLYLLERLPVHERQAVNKVLSGNDRVLPAFEKHECIFVHVPKCAGESICRSLFSGEGPGHLPLSWYERVAPEFYERAFKFAFVRDPVERAYSAYCYLKADRGIRRDRFARSLAESYADFDAFVKGWICPENVLRQMHFAPQWLFLTNSVGMLDIDFIGHQESLAEGFEQVCRKLGVTASLEHVNQSQGKADSARAQCSPEALQRLHDVYQRDYELLGYKL